MITDHSILSEYPADNSYYIDYLYRPYQRKLIVTDYERGCVTDYNPWQQQGCKANVDPSRVALNWQWDFQKIHPNDPCPAGWHSIGPGGSFCTRSWQQGHESNFYTRERFGVEYQYNNGYTVSYNNPEAIKKLQSLDTAPTFQKRSVNPNTGHYVVYQNNKPSPNTRKYGTNPSRHSYLGK